MKTLLVRLSSIGDVVLVAAVGNDGTSTVAYPAGDRGVVGVSSTDATDALDGSSSYGEAVSAGPDTARIVHGALMRVFEIANGERAAQKTKR